MDHSQQVRAHRRRYGGSDRTRPFFRNPEYVRNNSLSKAKDLGISRGFLWETRASLGGITGTNTLFYKFTTTEETRIGARRISENRYTDSDVRVAIASENLDAIALGDDGFGWAATPTTTQISQLPPIIEYLGYVDQGFWQGGFSEYDDQVIARPYVAVSTIDDTLQGLAAGSPWAKLFPPGTYYLIISTDQWYQQDVRVQLAALAANELSGDCTFAFEPGGRTNATQIGGNLDLLLMPSGRLRDELETAGTADLMLEPAANLQITSPV